MGLKVDCLNYRQFLDGKLWDCRSLVDLANHVGIDRIVVTPGVEFRPDNAGLAEDMKASPAVIGCVQVNPQLGAQAVQEVECAVGEWGMRGLKLMPTLHGYPVESPIIFPVMDKVAELQIPVTIHSGTYNAFPLEIALLAERYPSVPIIMDHMGYRFRESQAVAAALRCPNIYLMTSLVSVEPVRIKRAVTALGPERILFGSNAPSAYPDLAIEAIRRLKLGAEAEALIFGLNAARIYRLEEMPVPAALRSSTLNTTADLEQRHVSHSSDEGRRLSGAQTEVPEATTRQRYQFHHVAINTSDLDSAVGFYQEIFGLQLIRVVALQDGCRVAYLQAQGVTLELSERSGLEPQKCGLAHIALVVEDMDETCARLKAQGISFGIEPRPGKVDPRKRFAFIKAPDNVLVELTEQQS